MKESIIQRKSDSRSQAVQREQAPPQFRFSFPRCSFGHAFSCGERSVLYLYTALLSFFGKILHLLDAIRLYFFNYIDL